MARQVQWNGSSSDIESNGHDSKSKAKVEIVEPVEPSYQPVDWKKVFLTPKYIPLWIVIVVVGVLTAVITLKHDQVVAALRPFAEKVRDIPAGWLIFVAVLFIISFPPLFGHELVALLAGVVYGLWIGFAVVAAGTFIGEIGTWFAFKKFLRKKAEKMEKTNLTYGAMARLCRDGGFWIVLVIRLSVIPSHLSTAVFSTCDIKFWYFAVSTFLTLPKQLILVYLGVLLVQDENDSSVKTVLFVFVGLITIAAGVWIWFKMRSYKKQLLDEQAQRQRNKEAQRLGCMTWTDSGYSAGPVASDPQHGTVAAERDVSPPATTTTRGSRTSWRHGPIQEQHSVASYGQTPAYQPYRPQEPETGPHGSYEHHGQDSYYYYRNDDTGDMGTAHTTNEVYEQSPLGTQRQHGLRKVDSNGEGQQATNKDFI